MKGRKSNLILFHYLDYRQFLRDWYREAKNSRASFSLRAFSKRAGFGSPNFLKLVMDGDRNLTEESLSKFMIGLTLNKQEQEFFRNLVFFNQARDHVKRDYYYQRLLQSRKFSELKPIAKEKYDFYRAWYHPVIRELLISPSFDGTPESIVKQLLPLLSLTQVERSIDLLSTLGFIEPDGKGKWRQKTPLVSTGLESEALMLLNYHQNLLDLIKALLPRISPDRRDVSALTLGISRDKLPELKRKIQAFRKEILKMVSTESTPEEVVILAIQFLPVTKPIEAM